MKKRNVILVGLLSLSLLAGCRADILDHSQQDIKQEKVEKDKKEIENENKRGKASSTKIITPNTSESTQIESTQKKVLKRNIHTIRKPTRNLINK